jgi:hypothetical protein
MTSTTPFPAQPADPTHHVDGDDFSTAATATENTPLLQSHTSSTGTLRDGSSDGHRDAAASTDSSEEPVIGWQRGLCIILSMWALIFLQGN